MKTSDYDTEYQKLINEMARDMDLSGELPNMYGEEFRKAVSNRLLREKLSSLKSYDYHQFSALIDKSRKDGDLLELVARYIKYDEEDESKSSLAIKIADTLMTSALRFYRDDIEEAVEDRYKKYYEQDYLKTFGSFDQQPHAI